MTKPTPFTHKKEWYLLKCIAKNEYTAIKEAGKKLSKEELYTYAKELQANELILASFSTNGLFGVKITAKGKVYAEQYKRYPFNISEQRNTIIMLILVMIGVMIGITTILLDHC